jgi:hypothetical protein
MSYKDFDFMNLTAAWKDLQINQTSAPEKQLKVLEADPE